MIAIVTEEFQSRQLHYTALVHTPTSPLVALHLLEEGHPRRHGPTTLAENPHGHRQKHDEDVQPANSGKYLQWAHLGNPRADEVVHSERVNVTQIERGKCFWSFRTMAFRDVSVDPEPVSIQRVQYEKCGELTRYSRTTWRNR